MMPQRMMKLWGAIFAKLTERRMKIEVLIIKVVKTLPEICDVVRRVRLLTEVCNAYSKYGRATGG